MIITQVSHQRVQGIPVLLVVTAGREGNEVIVGVTQGLDAIGGRVGLAYSTTEVEDNTGTTYQDVDVIYLETQVAF